MTALLLTFHLVLGLSLGALLGFMHALASRRAAERALAAKQPGALLLGFPLRVAVPGLALFGLTLLSLWALAGGLLAFLLGSRLALARAANHFTNP
jgi:hypothetical protein